MFTKQAIIEVSNLIETVLASRFMQIFKRLKRLESDTESLPGVVEDFDKRLKALESAAKK